MMERFGECGEGELSKENLGTGAPMERGSAVLSVARENIQLLE